MGDYRGALQLCQEAEKVYPGAPGIGELIAHVRTRIIPFPPSASMKIIFPNPKFPKEVIAFSGEWEGACDGITPSRLTVKTVNLQEANLVYGVAEDPRGTFKASWSRETANVMASNSLQWGGGSKPKITLTMNQDLKTISGKCELRGEVSQIIMTKKQ